MRANPLTATGPENLPAASAARRPDPHTRWTKRRGLVSRLWEVENFDRVVAPAPANGNGGFTLKDVTWILAHSPGETLVLKP